MADAVNRMAAKLKANTGMPAENAASKTGADFSAVDFGGSLGQSVFENTREFLTGQRVSPQTAEFDARHNVLGTAIDIGAAVVPYAGWSRVARNIKPLEDFVGKIDPDNARPFLGGMAREATRMAPFEAARNAVNMMVGDKSAGEMAGESALNIGLGGLGAGLIGKLSSSGRASVSLNDLLPEAINSKPLQEQFGMLNDAIKAGRFADDADKAATANNFLNRLSFSIRNENPGPGAAYVAPLEFGNQSVVNRLFKMDNGNSTLSKTLTRSGSGFAKSSDVDAVAGAAGLPAGFEATTRFPRTKLFTNDKAAQRFDSLVRSNMVPLANGAFYTKEADGGYYVVAKKIAGKIPQDDRWVMFKTSDVDSLNPDLARWKNALVDRSKIFEDPMPEKIGVEIYDKANDFLRQFPYQNLEAATRGSKSSAEVYDRFAKLTGLDKVPASGGMEQVKTFLRQHVAPAMYQFQSRPLAEWTRQMARTIFDDAAAKAQAIVYGTAKFKGSRNLIYQAVRAANPVAENLQGTPALKPLIDSLDDKGLADVWKVSASAMPFKDVQAAFAKGDISESAYNLLKAMDTNDKYMTDQIQKLGKHLGISTFVPEEGHYGLTRSWVGDFRVPIYQNNKLVYMASGKNAKNAEAVANGIVEDAKAQGVSLTIGKTGVAERSTEGMMGVNPVHISSPDFGIVSDAAKRAYSRVNKPKFFKERTGVGGFVGDSAPYTKADLEDIIRGHTYTQHKYMAELTAKSVLSQQLTKLEQIDPQAFVEVNQRLNDLAGKPGELAKATNQVVDLALSKFLGKNSATKIVGVANQAMFQLQLGMGNVAFPILNLLTPLQTMAPEIAYVLSANPRGLSTKYTALLDSGFYDEFVVGGMHGGKAKPIGSAGVLSVPKIMMEGLRRMGKPSDDFLEAAERAAREGVTDPRFIEEAVGENSTQVLKFREAFSSPQGMASWIMKLSEFMPASSEKFVRGYAFSTGHMMGKDLMGLKDEALYQFAKQFTERTMYLYSPADRARVITGPVGSLFGMFKNWQMHYIGGMMQYTGEAYYRNNLAPLLWQLAGTTAVGGIAATPAYLAANAISNTFANKDMMNLIYDNFGPTGGLLDGKNPSISDAMFLGLPAFLGVSLSDQATSPGADPARDASMLFSFVHWDRMKATAQFIGNATDVYKTTGTNPMADQTVRDNFVRAFLPKTLYRVQAQTEEGALKSLNTGYKQFDGLNLAQRMLYSAGFNPNEIELGYKVSDKLWRNQEEMKKQVQNYGKAWRAAQENEDPDALEAIMLRAQVEGVDISSVIRSARARDAKAKDNMFDRQFKQQDIQEYAPILGR